MERQTKDVSLPAEMQGRWVDVNDDTSELVITGGEIICFGKAIDYDYKVLETIDDAITVSLKVNDDTREDEFQRSNVTELVITPDGELHAYNVKFASEFTKAGH